MVDSYMWGQVNRISPEAPVPVCAVVKKENRLGGAANVALNIASMGAEPILCSVIGNDISGEILLSLMRNEHLSTQGMITSTQRQTTSKTRFLSGSSQLLRVDEETDREISKEEERDFIKRIFDILAAKRIDAIVFQDYDKGTITKNVIKKVADKAKQMNIPTSTDPKKRNFNHYNNITLFKPNLKELKEGLNLNFEDISKVNEDILMQAADILHKKHNIEKVFITLSDKGVFMMDYSEQMRVPYHIKAHLRQIADVSGAGDTVISVATLCLALKIKAADIARISNLAGGLVCEKVGVSPIDKNILYNELIKQI